MRILILCTGNSCRSQMAEGILRFLDPGSAVFSAGIRPEDAVNSYAVRAMKEMGIDISSHYPKPVGQFLKEDFDWLITVCDLARDACPDVLTARVKHTVHFSLEDPAGVKGTDEEILAAYRNTRTQIYHHLTTLLPNIYSLIEDT